MKTLRVYTLARCHSRFGLMLATMLWLSCDDPEDESNTTYINETSLEDVLYHQVSYDRPTILIFPKLTTVKNSIYFHQCVNIMEVHFPNLVSIGDEDAINPFFYFHQNEGLKKVEAPNLTTVYGYVYFYGNSSLDLSRGICGITDIYPRGDPDDMSCLEPYVATFENANNEKCFSEILHLCN